MFDTLSDKLQATLGGLGRGGRLDEEAISKAMREIRLALLEADVNLEVARDFTNAVKERALGQDVLKSLTPGQQVVKIVHEELTALMGSGDSRLAFGRPPTVILLAGLQGSGKTTAAAKLGAHAPPRREAPGPRRLRPPAPGGDRPARAARQADLDAGLRARPERPGRRRAPRPRGGAQGQASTSSSSTPPAGCTSTRS